MLWPTLATTAFGVNGLRKDYLHVAAILQLSWFKRLFTVILPGAAPTIVNGLRISFGSALVAVVPAEMLLRPGTSRGSLSDIALEDTAPALARAGIRVVATGVADEADVPDLIDLDVPFADDVTITLADVRTGDSLLVDGGELVLASTGTPAATAPDGFTMSEFREALGISRSTLYRRLEALDAAKKPAPARAFGDAA